MLYNYTPLLKTLHSKGITRKQLREGLRLSPATMARMSAGEPIALETLGRICDYLNCNLDKIFTISPNPEPPRCWDTLRLNTSNNNLKPKKTTFSVHLYLLLPTVNRTEKADSVAKTTTIENHDTETNFSKPIVAVYLYGYAIPFITEETDMNKWFVTYGKDKFKHFCQIEGALYENDIRRFLDGAMNKLTLKDIFSQFNITLIGLKAEDASFIHNVRIANGNFVYRPPYYLTPSNAALNCKEELTPLLSYEESATICESLYCTNKKEYYYDSNDTNPEKMRLLWEFFSEALPLHRSLNEMARLGNFEILTRPDYTAQQPLNCKVWRVNNQIKGAKITISSKYTGNLILHVKLMNSRNLILNNAYIINPQDEKTNPLYIHLEEAFSGAELELWSAWNSGVNGKNLLYHTQLYFIRQISAAISLVESRFDLIDSWSKAMQKQGKAVDTKVELYTTEKINPLINTIEEPWIKEEEKIQEDFHALYGDGRSQHKFDTYFKREADRAIAFLNWLKDRLAAREKRKQNLRILLFDPYITKSAICKLIRNIREANNTYEIITDSCPPGKKAREAEIKDIEDLSTTLGYLMPQCKLTVRTITKANGTLHDRILIIADGKGAEVYTLSNSLDSIAKKHSSIVTAVRPDVAQEIFQDYAKLVSRLEKENEIKTIYNSQNLLLSALPSTKTTNHEVIGPANAKSQINTEAKEDYISKNYYTNEDFIRDYSSPAIETALESLAYMDLPNKAACINYVLSLNHEEEFKRLRNLIKNYVTNPMPPLWQEIGEHVHNQNALAMQDFDLSDNLLGHATDSIEYHFEYRSAVPYVCFYAIRILWRLSQETYVQLLEELLKEQRAKIETTNLIFSQEARIIYTMLACILNVTASPQTTIASLNYLANSKTPYLRAIYAVKCIWLNNDFLNALIQKVQVNNKPAVGLEQTIQEKCSLICMALNATEAATTLVYLMKELQIQICRHQEMRERIQRLIDIIIPLYVQTLSENKKIDENCIKQQLTPLNMRNPSDICRIIQLMQKNNQLTNEQAYNVLLDFWNQNFLDENGREKEFYHAETIQRSKYIGDYIIQTDKTAAEQLQHQIEKRTRKLCALLYDPLLYTKDYTAWKRAIEQTACLLITERHIVAQQPGLIMGRGEAEFEKLTENHAETLAKYSKAYQIWKTNNPGYIP